MMTNLAARFTTVNSAPRLARGARPPPHHFVPTCQSPLTYPHSRRRRSARGSFSGRLRFSPARRVNAVFRGALPGVAIFWNYTAAVCELVI